MATLRGCHNGVSKVWMLTHVVEKSRAISAAEGGTEPSNALQLVLQVLVSKRLSSVAEGVLTAVRSRGARKIQLSFCS